MTRTAAARPTPDALAAPERAAAVIDTPLVADVDGLLRAYRDVLADVAAPSGGLARWTAPRFAVSYVRRTVDVLQRRCCLRLALADDEEDDEASRLKLERFAASLPPSRSPIWSLLPLLAIFTVVQILTSVVDGVDSALVNQLSSIDQPDVSEINHVIAMVLTNDPISAIYVGWLFAVSAWIVLRPLVSGVRRTRRLLARPAVRVRETELFARLGMRPPPEPGFDLWVKGCAAVAILLMGADLLVLWAKGADSDLGTERMGIGLVLLGAAVVRLVYLAREGGRRRSPPAVGQ